MKKKYLLFISLIISQISFGQAVNDSVNVGANYVNQSYYSLLNGEVSNVDNNNWDLAFDASGFGSAISINGQAQCELYLYPKGDTAAWSTVDTTGMSSWKMLQNSDTSWYYGAFQQTTDPGSATDLGWGEYSTITHAVTGDSLYVMKISSGSWKKLWIQKLASRVYSFRYADLDGSNEVNKTLKKENFPDRIFGYYSLVNDQELDREPNKSDWDLVFTKYIAQLGPGVYYGVTGALQNMDVAVAKAYPVNEPFTYSSYGSHNLLTPINTMGYDWKRFDMGQFKYVIEDSTCYFVRDVPGNVWRITFTNFGGSSNGKIGFAKEQLTQVGISERESNSSFSVYPNPASENVNIIYTATNDYAQVQLYTLTGKLVLEKDFNKSGFNAYPLSLEGIHPGVYFLRFTNGTDQHTQKLIVQ